MATEAQKRQRKLFVKKGMISCINSLSSILSTDDTFSKVFKDRCLVLNWYAKKLLTEFNKEVGWEEKKSHE